MVIGRTGEESVRSMILAVLSDGKVRTTADINQSVKKRLAPTEEDAVRANKRLNEAKYDTIIGNALQVGRPLCRTGLVERLDEGQFRIAASGLEQYREEQVCSVSMSQTRDELFSPGMWE